MVMPKLKKEEDVQIIKMLMREKRKDTSIKVLNGNGITVSDEQEVERFWGKLFFTNGKVTLGEKREVIGNRMTSEGRILFRKNPTKKYSVQIIYMSMTKIRRYKIINNLN